MREMQKRLSETAYDADFFNRLRKTHKLRRDATCISCVEKGEGRKTKKQRVWLQETYPCTECKLSLPPWRFEAVRLRKLEDEKRLYLAVCDACDTRTIEGPPVQCNLCGDAKPRKEFTAARRQRTQKSTWRCRTCDYPPCTDCGVYPEKALRTKERPWTCQSCLYPPCPTCGKERPRRTAYQRNNLPDFCCSE